MRRALLVVLLLGGLVAALALALAPARGALAEPLRACAPGGPLALAFGDARAEDARTLVPVFVENRGNETARVAIREWEVDSYRVRWDGKLAPLVTQATHVDFVEGYEGETLAPGARMTLGEVQLPARGQLLLVGFAGGACGATTLRA